METRPLSRYFGVELLGLDPAAPLSPQTVTELNALFDRHRLLLIRGHKIDDATHVKLINALCPVVKEGASGLDYTFNSAKPTDYIGGTGGIAWHSDYHFVPHGPVQVVSLCALVMERNEPTRFNDSVQILRSLPPDLRERLAHLNVVQVQSWYDVLNQDGTKRARLSEYSHVPKEQLAIGIYPAIRTHPRTGEAVMMVSEQVTSHFEGMTEAESDPILNEIATFQNNPEFVYQHDWQAGDLVIWDNFALQHGRPPLERTTNRLLRRVAGNPIPVHEIMAGVVPALPTQRSIKVAA